MCSCLCLPGIELQVGVLPVVVLPVVVLCLSLAQPFSPCPSPVPSVPPCPSHPEPHHLATPRLPLWTRTLSHYHVVLPPIPCRLPRGSYTPLRTLHQQTRPPCPIPHSAPCTRKPDHCAPHHLSPQPLNLRLPPLHRLPREPQTIHPDPHSLASLQPLICTLSRI